jgi:hypothetical protein
MKKNESKMYDFFQSSDLKNLNFYIYYPTQNNENKEEISELIINNKGVSQKHIIILNI